MKTLIVSNTYRTALVPRVPHGVWHRVAQVTNGSFREVVTYGYVARGFRADVFPYRGLSLSLSIN